MENVEKNLVGKNKNNEKRDIFFIFLLYQKLNNKKKQTTHMKILCGWRDLNSHEHYSSDSKSEASTIPPNPLNIKKKEKQILFIIKKERFLSLKNVRNYFLGY